LKCLPILILPLTGRYFVSIIYSFPACHRDGLRSGRQVSFYHCPCLPIHETLLVRGMAEAGAAGRMDPGLPGL
jgi:hypothetical protein